MVSVQRCAAQHPGRRASETVCRQFQCSRLHFSRRHLRQIWLSWRHGLPLGTGIWGGEDAEFEPRRLRRTWRLSRFWPITWNQSQSVAPTGAGFGSLHRRLRQQTVLRRLNTKHPPGKGPFAVRAAPVLSPWLPSVAPAAVAAVVVVSGAVRQGPPAARPVRRVRSPVATGSPYSGAAKAVAKATRKRRGRECCIRGPNFTP
jgi:hypothetical protein